MAKTPLGRVPVRVKPDDFRDAEPELAGDHDHGHVGRPHPGAEGPEGPVRRRVGVGGHQDHARVNQAVVHHGLVADPLVHIEEKLNVLLPAEIAELLLILGRLDGRGRGIMVHDENKFPGIVNLFPPHLVKGTDGLEINVVHFPHVHPAVDDLPGDDRVFPRGFG